jgi:hypothetical protein
MLVFGIIVSLSNSVSLLRTRLSVLIQSLNAQRLNGDASLIPFVGSTPGNTLAEKFWSMHSYRREARSHVSRKRATNGCKTFEDEVNEHGRWRVKRSSLSLSRGYLQWSIADSFLAYCSMYVKSPSCDTGAGPSSMMGGCPWLLVIGRKLPLPGEV